MNAIELYKNLPRKNCGQCRPKTCMNFAFALLRGDSEIAECTLLSKAETEELKGKIPRTDWREDLISKLRAEVSGINFSDIAPGLGAGMRGESLVIRSLDREFVISPDGEITTSGHMTPWMKILLLHYTRTRGEAALSGRWVSYSELKSGMVKASSFRRECEEPLRELFDRDFAAVSGILRRLGAEEMSGFAARNAWRLMLLPKMPFLILYWPQEDEFPSKVSVLLDSTADQFLDVESLIFLGEGLIENIEGLMQKGDTA